MREPDSHSRTNTNTNTNIRRGGGATTGDAAAATNNHSNTVVDTGGSEDNTIIGDYKVVLDEEDGSELYACSSVDDEFKSSFSGLWESGKDTRGEHHKKRSKHHKKKNKNSNSNSKNYDNKNNNNNRPTLATTLEEDLDSDKEGEEVEEEDNNEEETTTDEQVSCQEETTTLEEDHDGDGGCGSPQQEDSSGVSGTHKCCCCCTRVLLCGKCHKTGCIVGLTILGLLLMAILGTYLGLCRRTKNNNYCTLRNVNAPPSSLPETTGPSDLPLFPVPEQPSPEEEYPITTRQSDIQAELVRLMESDNDVVQNYETILTQPPRNSSSQSQSQYEAFEWIVKDDLQQLLLSVSNSSNNNSTSRLAQRYGLAVLYYSVVAEEAEMSYSSNGNGSSNSSSSTLLQKTWLSNTHECLWEGVTCRPPYIPLVVLDSSTSTSTTPKSMLPPQEATPKEDVLDANAAETTTSYKNGVMDRKRKHDDQKEEEGGVIGRRRRQLLSPLLQTTTGLSLRSLIPSTQQQQQDTDTIVPPKNDAALVVQDHALAVEAEGDDDDPPPISHVVGLELSHQGLRGVVPLELKLLTKLETLDLSGNTGLTALDWDGFDLLHHNLFPNLHTLVVANNPRLQGTLHIYDEQAAAAQLQQIDIRNTSLNVQVARGIQEGAGASGNDDDTHPSENGFLLHAPCLLIEESILLLEKNDKWWNAIHADCSTTSVKGNETIIVLAANSSSPSLNTTGIKNETDPPLLLGEEIMFFEENQTAANTTRPIMNNNTHDTHDNVNVDANATSLMVESMSMPPEANETTAAAVVTASSINSTIIYENDVNHGTDDSIP
jgi:hypothetical protein